MATIVFFHAHPDDEAMSTGGTIARASQEGHRVVLVVATDGAHGERPADLADGETLVDRRRLELHRSAAALGIHKVVWFGRADSGMTGWDQNSHPSAFMQMPVEAGGERLAEILRHENADVLVVYDWHGNYGHPDHIQVHRVGHRAAELAGTPRVFEATMNRDAFRRMVSMMPDPDGFDPDGPADDGNPIGMAEHEITHFIDVSAYLELKKASLRSHASQISDASFFMQMPDEVFAMAFGTEWFREPARIGNAVADPLGRSSWLFE